MEDELDAYAERMSSMSDSAVDSETFEQICEGLQSRGFTIQNAEPLMTSDQAVPLAWVLIATK